MVEEEREGRAAPRSGGDEEFGTAPAPDETFGEAPATPGTPSGRNLSLLVGGLIGLLVIVAAVLGFTLR